MLEQNRLYLIGWLAHSKHSLNDWEVIGIIVIILIIKIITVYANPHCSELQNREES